MDQFQYDRLIVSRFGEDNQIAQTLRGELERTEGLPEDIFACLAKVYRSPADRRAPLRYDLIQPESGN